METIIIPKNSSREARLKKTKQSTLDISNTDISKSLKSTLLYQRIQFGYISYFHLHFISYHFKLLISQSKFSGPENLLGYISSLR